MRLSLIDLALFYEVNLMATKKQNIKEQANDLSDLVGSLVKEEDGFETYADTKQGGVYNRLPTLIPSVDFVMMGGIPMSGRSTEIYGEPNVGKSTFMGNLLKTAQRMNIMPFYFDSEQTMDRERLKHLGVNLDLIVARTPQVNKRTGEVTPITVEDVFSNIKDLSVKIGLEKPNIKLLFIWDTVAESPTMAQANDDMGQQRVGTKPKALSEGLQKITATMSYYGSSMIALNQLREDFGAALPQFKKAKTVGGLSWEHQQSLRLNLSKGKTLFEDIDGKKTDVGHMVRIAFNKSKIGNNTGAKTEVVMFQDTGFDEIYNTIEDAIKIGVLEQKGAYVVYGEGKTYKSKLYEKLKDPANVEEFNELWRQTIKAYFPTCYPPLFNVDSTLSEENFPQVKGLFNYYKDIQDKLPDNKQHESYINWQRSSK